MLLSPSSITLHGAACRTKNGSVAAVWASSLLPLRCCEGVLDSSLWASYEVTGFAAALGALHIRPPLSAAMLAHYVANFILLFTILGIIWEVCFRFHLAAACAELHLLARFASDAAQVLSF